VTHVRVRYDEKKRVARLWVGGGADQTHKVVDVDRERRETLVHEACEVACTTHIHTYTYTHIHTYNTQLDQRTSR
jgi:coproporphyrinogen III oxidase